MSDQKPIGFSCFRAFFVFYSLCNEWDWRISLTHKYLYDKREQPQGIYYEEYQGCLKICKEDSDRVPIPPALFEPFSCFPVFCFLFLFLFSGFDWLFKVEGMCSEHSGPYGKGHATHLKIKR